MEQWKYIEGYENYKVNSLWIVERNWKEISLWKNSSWYVYITVSKNWIKKNFIVHRLVATYFIKNIENKPQVNHKNWVKTDNRVENLEWCTISENQIHSRNILNNKVAFQTNHPDKWKFWKDNRHSKKVNQYTKDGIFIKTWDSMMDIQRELWIKQWMISDVCRWKNNTCRNFIWKYV